MFWKPILAVIVCLIGGILWTKSERNKRMVPIIIALIPCLDVVFVQIPAIQRIYERLSFMTTAAGGCTVGLGDFIYGGFLLGIIFVSLVNDDAKPLFLTALAAGAITLTSAIGLKVTMSLPGVMMPQTPWVLLGALPFLYIAKNHWLVRGVSTTIETFFSEKRMMVVGWRACAALTVVGAIVFTARL
ncbi:MAG: hypothetical protein WCG99_03985 [Candidatus Berkelbacteria bacterium]